MFIQQTMKTASSDEELAFRQKDRATPKHKVMVLIIGLVLEGYLRNLIQNQSLVRHICMPLRTAPH